MFLGHFAVGFAVRANEPRTSLGTCFAAAQLPDLIWPVLLLAGVERVVIAPGDTAFTPLRFESYPYSHSLVTVAVFGLLFALVHWLVKRNGRAARTLAGLVLSHWVLDYFTHRPDMPIIPGNDQLLGLGLWNSVPATIIIEGLMFVAGVAWYLRVTRPKDGVGRYGLAGLILFLVVSYFASAFGPPPPSVTAIAVVCIAGSLLIPWAAWVDRHRTTA
jgi:membrane-bound metal-dependent hydrolase YbcI (DUF457 family)